MTPLLARIVALAAITSVYLALTVVALIEAARVAG